MDENLERCCVALRRQRKPIRQQIHRMILLNYVRQIAPIVGQVCSLAAECMLFCVLACLCCMQAGRCALSQLMVTCLVLRVL